MDLLSVVTLISLAVALGLTGVTARLLRDERRRSEARIAALTAAAAEHDDSARNEPTPEENRTIVRRPAPRRPARAAVDPVESRLVDDVDRYRPAPDDVQPLVASGNMFAAAEAPQSTSSRVVPLVVVGGVVLAAVIALAVWSGPRGSATEAAGEGRPQTVATVPPLELVALKHRRDGDRLAISGIVKNPSGSRPIKNISAVVFLFDQNGSFLSSGRAPIDFTTLTPGDESPFVVVVTEPGAVARYRVSFRSDDHVMPHVDHRDPAGATSAPQVRGAGGVGRMAARLVG